MKRQKRDTSNRMFSRGYQAGLAGKSRDICQFTKLDQRANWMTGWRAGREDYWNGMEGVSAIHRNPMIV
ncbi:ribosome modulation factor [Pokkaliibacter plantistimulans]|uniref:Ribosome modulation factor n=2 Tax=Pseudomonadota TaxID=1224 RepID=A0ABX5M2L2_9GAMM|nr:MULTISPECIES: ribosome modulation factor [Pokkaliibacter]MDH2435156.1 ribosome modulation factor [Pokkaliibacter sp. MBI-7]PPC77176.1 ribosome modulation factor [Pokkaliibacter plantistimulans]PXF33145.1 ribosome modulation factor [Pokkaliibacter plantistimulans]